MKSKRDSTSSFDTQFWDDIKSRVDRIQDLTVSHSIEGPQELLRTTKLLIDFKTASKSIPRYDADTPSPKTFDSSSYTFHETEKSDFSIISEAPSQISFSNIHSNWPNVYEDEISRVKDESRSLQSALNQRLSAFRNASKSCVTSNVRIQTELDWYREEMKSIKKSVHDLLEDTKQSKQEMEKAREHLIMTQYGRNKLKTPVESPELDYSVSKCSYREHLGDKILELNQELNAVNDKLLLGEEKRTQIERENREMKEIVCKLEDAISLHKHEILIEKVTSIQKVKENSCSDGCYIF